MTIADRIRVKNVRVLSDSHYVLKTTTFEWRRANGEWQTQHRETYDRGNGVRPLLPYNLAQRTVVLVRQFRYPAFVSGCDDLLIEAAAGLLDNERRSCGYAPRSRKENRLSARRSHKDFEAFMSPGAVTESCTSLSRNMSRRCGSAAAAALPPRARRSRCWNCRSTRRSPMIADGRIADAKTIMCCNMRR